MAYVGNTEAPGGCVFCDAVASSDDRGRLVLTRGERAFLIVNAYPYASGHVMAVLNRHVASVEDASLAELADAMALVQAATRAIRHAYRPQGFNIGVNQGAVAGAGIDGHLHVHVVPRWAGDTNFMTVLGDVKVLPETLESTYDRLRAALTA
jgi:ATP adenylyltransferase